MIEGSSSHHVLNYKDSNDNNLSKDELPPVIERLEEYASQNNDDQKMFSRTNSIINKEDTYKETLKDSIISQILINLDSNDDKSRKRTSIYKTKSLFNNIPKTLEKKPKKKSVIGLTSSKNLLNKLNKLEKKKEKEKEKKKEKVKEKEKEKEKEKDKEQDKEKEKEKENEKENEKKRKSSFLGIKSKKRISSFINSQNKISHFNNKKDASILASKRKTISIISPRKIPSQAFHNLYNMDKKDLERSTFIFKKATFKEKSNLKSDNNHLFPAILSKESNKKLINPMKKYSGMTIDSRLSDELGFSDLIKQNKIQLVRGLTFKQKLNNQDKKLSYIEKMLRDPNFMSKGKFYKKIKVYSFIQSVTSIISILLCVVDIGLFNKYSYDYIIQNNIKYDKYYEIGKREINAKENILRVLNGFASFICLIMTICIFISKYNFNKIERKKELHRRNKNTNFQLSLFYDISNGIFNQAKLAQNVSVSKTILRSAINIIFYPPKLNYIYYSYSENILYVYPFNTFILLLSSFKLYNVYRCIFYFIPITGTLGKQICQRYNVRLNIKYMFKTFLMKHKASFPFFIVIILTVVISILLQSVEEFSVDIDLYKSIDLNTLNSLNNKFIANHDLNIYDTIWIYISFLLRNPLGDLYPKTPFGKMLLFIIYIIGSLFLCLIYYRLNRLMQLDNSRFQAFTKLTKLFKDENKENKASDVIRSVFLLKKYYSLFNVDKIEEDIMNTFTEKKRRKTLIDEHIYKLRAKNILLLKQKKVILISVKFGFILKYFVDIKNYMDIYKISRKQPINISSMFQNMEDKMDDSLESLNVKLTSIRSIDGIFQRLKNNENILIKKLQKIRKLDNSVMKYLSELNNLQSSNFLKYRNRRQTELIKRLSHKRSKTKLIFNFKASSCKSISEQLK